LELCLPAKSELSQNVTQILTKTLTQFLNVFF